MFPKLGTQELLIILVIVLLLFGVGRIGKIAGELCKGIKEFRKGLTPDEKETPTDEKPEEVEKTEKVEKTE